MYFACEFVGVWFISCSEQSRQKLFKWHLRVGVASQCCYLSK